MPAMTSNPLTQTSAQGRGVTRHSARTLNVSFSQALVSVADRVETVEFGLPDCCERYELEVSLRPRADVPWKMSPGNRGPACYADSAVP